MTDEESGLIRIEITTRHPENYVLVNVADLSRWVIEDGQWKRLAPNSRRALTATCALGRQR